MDMINEARNRILYNYKEAMEEYIYALENVIEELDTENGCLKAEIERLKDELYPNS